MAALPDPLSFQVPPPAAPGLSDYPQFAECEVPAGSGAIKAYKGFIRPFSDDQNAREAFRAIEANIPLQVSSGRISVDASHLRKHPFENYLNAMAVPLSILVLEFEGLEHPRAFLVGPRMVPRLSQSPHIRTDKSVQINGRKEPALCVYSGSLFEFVNGRDRLEQFLDQTATYLAKYLIWLRTRQLFIPTGYNTRRFVYRRKPHEGVSELEIILSPHVYWDGFWPGLAAPTGPAQHLATIKRSDKCWCWSGKQYGECCRPLDIERNKQPHLGGWPTLNPANNLRVPHPSRILRRVG